MAPNIVLTAAHCFPKTKDPKDHVVRVGDLNLNKKEGESFEQLIPYLMNIMSYVSTLSSTPITETSTSSPILNTNIHLRKRFDDLFALDVFTSTVLVTSSFHDTTTTITFTLVSLS